MRDLKAPPLSSSIGVFRTEVDRRAEALGRRHRRTIGGGVAAVALIVLALSSVLVADSTTSHETTSSTAGRAPAPVAGGARAGSEPGPADTEPPSAGGQRAGTFGGAANGPSDTYVMDDRPSGYVGTGVLTGMNVTVLLPAPGTGRWGRAAVAKGNGTVLTLFAQGAQGTGGVQVTFKAHQLGTAVVAIPLLGDPAGSWLATIIVTGVGAPACSPNGVCH
jgi:hypothetical protein